ncbi:DUF222 domain-containing protein [Kocuria sp. CPCC 205263]|uniref:HNH endonuclease signature motif containing protein n=1 Tax=Kocuria sp. CPCC 205263 TaxID=3073555 RepID=UPI0034D6CF25
MEPEEDGMARLCALLDAATAHAVHARLASIAARVDPHSPPSDSAESACGGQGVAEGPGPDDDRSCWEDGPRTAGQLRADVLAALLLDGEPTCTPEHLRGIRGQVTVTVPVLSLPEHSAQTPGRGSLGRSPGGGWLPGGSPSAGGTTGRGGPAGSPGCAELAGYGPIPVSVAERIAAGAGSRSRVLTHPVTGTVLDHDRTTYAVPADLKRRLRARDGTRRFPGCRRRAERCDLDHTVAWVEGGPTAADNLAHLCRHHHVLEHRDGPLGRWRVRHRRRESPEGVLEWTSPAGRVHVTYPQQHHHPVLSPLGIADDLPVDGRPPAEQAPDEPSPAAVLWTSRRTVPSGARPHEVRPDGVRQDDDPTRF